MASKFQWSVVVVVAVLGALLLVSLGGFLGWALARPAISGWAWPFQMGPWMMGGPSGYGGMMGPGSPGSGRIVPSRGGEALSLEEAQEAVEGYLQSLGLSGLAIAEVMEFTENFYAEVEEESTGVHAMELLIDKYTGAVYPEYGPNMMWNTKYGMHSGSGWRGMMGGMMRRFGLQEPSADMPVSADQALQYAQRYLDAYLPGTQVAEEADRFYGYYTIHVLKDGQIYGMLSVNGYSGQVWYHNWHGQFLGMLELHEE